MSLKHNEIITIIRLFRESQFNNLHLECSDFKLAISKDGQVIAPPDAGNFVGSISRTETGPVESPGLKKDETGSAPIAPSAALDYDQIEREGLEVFNSPMLGVFYRAPSPGADPFVKKGSQVKKGETLCIIEVMKLYTSIAAGARGEIVEIYVEDGQMVEYGQPLFLIKPIAEPGGV